MKQQNDHLHPTEVLCLSCHYGLHCPTVAHLFDHLSAKKVVITTPRPQHLHPEGSLHVLRVLPT